MLWLDGKAVFGLALPSLWPMRSHGYCWLAVNESGGEVEGSERGHTWGVGVATVLLTLSAAIGYMKRGLCEVEDGGGTGESLSVSMGVVRRE